MFNCLCLKISSIYRRDSAVDDRSSHFCFSFLHLADGHVHSYYASSCGETGQELFETSSCGVHRLCWQTSREGRTEGAADVRGREEVRQAQTVNTKRLPLLLLTCHILRVCWFSCGAGRSCWRCWRTASSLLSSSLSTRRKVAMCWPSLWRRWG